MEFQEHGFLEEFLAQKRETWETIPNFPTEMNELIFSNGWNYNNNFFDETLPSNSFCEGFPDEDFNNYFFNEILCCPLEDESSAEPQLTDDFSAPQFTDSSSHNTFEPSPPFSVKEDSPVSTLEDQNLGLIPNDTQNLEFQATCKLEPILCPDAVPTFSIGAFPERKMRGKKMEGQPSKNLMAERRRRKRLNDRLSMLRSIVPKISKMDRTSIVGDTIDYMKELMERINNLQQQMEVGSNQFNMMGIFNDTKANEITIRNSPKFDVERRNVDSGIEICCANKPGLLLSTVTTLEALGLEIQQCVISCFNDFAMQASCSEELEQRAVISCEDIKQALFRSAGYGGRCL